MGLYLLPLRFHRYIKSPASYRISYRKQLQTEDAAEAARAKDAKDWGLDEDLFGDSQFDIDDLDADGFQDLSFDDGSMF